MLHVDADRTTAVVAQEPAPPHITQTHADCTPTKLDREPATPLLTPTPADRHPVPVDTAPSLLITHKYRGSQQFSMSKSVEPNEELKVEQRLPQVLSTTDTTLRTLDVRFT